MTLGLSPEDRAIRLRGELRRGRVLGLRAEAGSALVMAVETGTEPRLQALRDFQVAMDLAVPGRRAAALGSASVVGDVARLHVPEDMGLAEIARAVDPVEEAGAPRFLPRLGGSDLAHRAAIRLAKDALLLPAVIVVPLRREAFENAVALHQLDVAPAEAVLAGRPGSGLTAIAKARVPLERAEGAVLHVFRPADGGEEQYAIEVGTAETDDVPLTRVHSACVTGDLFHSLKCDCGQQLDAALAAMGAAGRGILLYLDQEGRGIGLANKMRAYALQDRGLDTVEANHRLGFEDDERDFRIAAEMLEAMGVRRIRLMTNNPRKVSLLQENGIEVAERVPLQMAPGRHNARYLAVKAEKSGHLL